MFFDEIRKLFINMSIYVTSKLQENNGIIFPIL